ncbi:MAG TPA: aminotransferase class I/II-fold pyridoxal phosphate-dependent enzyme [Planctomycetota bacterium]|nr:aminotransferase class I/II-fold pyridoxal phosphate-dependent enzyme [Planctomycetota bacterium]HRR80397.1 aminotransferase class I/II-fold pyridoxal phosphate-dependent enzyme [Planctomycetota bacterium]HRT95376.1 aminotransferase class I/II-fold pyridoxal phosphate-dependent enzyme [Planctomycetota bacterium]
MEFEALKKSGITNLLSAFGKSISLPQGIFYWTGRAKKEATIDATIGSAQGPESEIIAGAPDKAVTFYLPSVQRHFAGLKSEETVPYAPMLGLPDLRKAWRDWILRKVGPLRERVEPCLSLPAVTPGVTGGLFLAAKLFLDKDEVVVSPDRLWENYSNIVERHIGARIETFPFFEAGRFNLKGMQRKLLDTLAQQPKALLMLNFPNNPVGFNPPQDMVQPIVQALIEVVEQAGKPIVVLCDDAYEGYVYDPAALQRSMFGDLCDAHRRILPIKLDGISKEFLFYGGRLGCLTFGLPSGLDVDRKTLQEELDNKLGGIVRSTVSNCTRPVQSAILKALGQLDQVLAERQRTVDVLGRRANLLKAEFAKVDLPQLKLLPFNAGFFCFCDVEGVPANKLAEHLIAKYKIGVVPSEGGKINGIRIAFCSVPEKDIPTLVNGIVSAIKDLAENA